MTPATRRLVRQIALAVAVLVALSIVVGGCVSIISAVTNNQQDDRPAVEREFDDEGEFEGDDEDDDD